MESVLKKDKKTIIFELAYYIFFSVLLFLQFMETTMIDISRYRQILKFVLLFFGILLVAKIVLEWTKAWDVKAIITGIVCVGFILLPVLNYMMDLTVGFCLIILASRNISSRKTLKIYVFLSTVLTIFVIIYCLIGKVDNFVVFRDATSTHKRQALGFIYATYLSAHIMGICTVWAYIRGRAISWAESLIIVVLGVYAYYLTEARISCAVITFTGIIMVVTKLLYQKKIDIKIFDNRIIKWLLILSSDLITLFAIIMGLTYKYGNLFFEFIDKLASGRLQSNALSFDRYNISLWGQRLTFVGNYIEKQHGVADNYYMINCSYILILFKFGIAGLLAVLVGWNLISYRAYKKKEYYKLLILSSLSIYFFFEQRIYIFCIIPFWILLLSDENVEFFDLYKLKIYSRLAKYKKQIYIVLTMLVVSFGIDLLLYNNNCFMNMMKEAVKLEDVTMESGGIAESIDGKYKIDRSTLEDNQEPYILIANIFSPIGVDSFELGFDFYEITNDGDYRYVDNVQFSYDLVSLEGDGQFYKVASKKCNSSKPITWYTSLNEDSVVSSFYIYFKFDEKYIFDIKNIDFNGPVPYDFNPGRLALIWLILSALALVLSSGKKPENKENDDVDGAVKEEKQRLMIIKKK